MNAPWLSESAPPWIDQSAWEKATTVGRWRRMRRSTIRNLLRLSRTSYLNRDPNDARRRCQRLLAGVRATRPQVPA